MIQFQVLPTFSSCDITIHPILSKTYHYPIISTIILDFAIKTKFIIIDQYGGPIPMEKR